MTGAQAAWLPDRRRLHLHHGPIDLIVEASGPAAAVAEGYRRAVARFESILDELVEELPALRSADEEPLRGPVALAMTAAVRPYRASFITPMAAVAGAVADAVCARLVSGGGLARAYVNNGGDIALHLAPGATLAVAVAAQPGLPDRVTIAQTDPVRGIATSGWRGRSWSFGIADAVTVLARTAAAADAAATAIANVVDLPGHPAIGRTPARDLQADSDLGHRRVTTAVGPLVADEVAAALAAGLARAEALRAAGHIFGAALFLRGEARATASPLLESLAPEPALA